ncbi:acyltransferase [Roseateles amylovorans]|uniref:Acyltransferase n=2 Tax=Roseateles amylovorans TaxID=2978473 RepID=A0ABY6B7J0_9BURK|nr:acyltransferase [Roseateles amylovorans]
MVPYDEVDLLRPVTIERFVWVGMRAMILPGVTLREGTIVGAGAVVTKSHPAGAILGGNPATQIGSRDMEAFRELVAQGRHYLVLKQKQGLRKREVLDPR